MANLCSLSEQNLNRLLPSILNGPLQGGALCHVHVVDGRAVGEEELREGRKEGRGEGMEGGGGGMVSAIWGER